MSESEQWFFVLDGEHAGPIDSQTLEGMIRSEHLPPDVLVCREGMQDWLPANEAGLINEPQASQKSHPPAEVDLAFGAQPNRSSLSSGSSSVLTRNEIYQKITFGLIALLIVILSIGGGLFAVQSKNHKKEVSSLRKTQSESKELTTKLVSDSEHLQHNVDQLNESKLSLETSATDQAKTISDLNTTNTQLAAQNRTLLENYRDATNKLNTLNNDGGVADERIQEANQRVASAESAALAAKQQLEQTIRQAQSQAAQLQKQINEKTSNTQEQLSAKESAIQSLSNELANLKTQLSEATNQVAGLKRELGENPIRIGSPSGPKPSVDTKPFSEIKYTDTEYNFAVINKGHLDGVKNGESFRVVSRESGEVIGELNIYRVNTDVSLGNLGTININSLKTGDLVYRK
ncbi:MAG: GYF domain-containing protein [Verrucomicrobiota bacterium]|jgi:hypothetical protein|nr:GYF domain-containing protein [Verrucomicrobiota bacterium]